MVEKSKVELADNLASIAFFVLDAREQTQDPTHLQAVSAVMRSAEMLDTVFQREDAPEIYIEAVRILGERHNWKLGAAVELGTTTARRGDDTAGREEPDALSPTP